MPADWTAIEALPAPRLETLFAEDPNRLAAFSVDVAGLHFDWSKTHLTAQAVAAFEALAKAQDLAGKREALFAGEIINTTEGRAVTHVAERGEGSVDDVAQARVLHARMRALIDAIEGEALGPIRHVLHVGIGGSALGPDLLIDALGREDSRYDVMLDGAGEMDRHFRQTSLSQTAPALAAFADLYYTQVRHAETRATFAYDERLRLLPSYLQQLEMESNGKGVTIDGKPLGRPSAAITWGGVGTDAQHAVFQLLHQGTHLVPVEFVAVIEPGDTLAEEHHRQLLLNAFAQGAALMKGRPNDDLARSYSGDRPSSTILLEVLDARTLGALIAFYEQRVFVNGVLLGINPFDQFGVELGKEMAKAADAGGQEFDVSTTDLIKRAFG